MNIDDVSTKSKKEERTEYDGFTGYEKVLSNGSKVFISDIIKDGKVYIRFYNDKSKKTTKIHISNEAAIILQELLSRSRYVDEEVFLAC